MPIDYELLKNHAVTRRQRIDVSLTTLRGYIAGIAADSEITPDERNNLEAWLDHHAEVGMHSPYGEIFDYIRDVTDAEFISAEQKSDLLHGIDAVNSHVYYDAVTSGIQELVGLVTGIAADGVIKESECLQLRDWMDQHENLKTHWPFDEIDSLLTRVMSDRIITTDEHTLLLAFFGGFKIDGRPLGQMPISVQTGIILYSSNPVISFNYSKICVTGRAERGTRGQIHRCIELAGGKVAEFVENDITHLVVCDRGNQAWAYSCYGRKIESAIDYRRNGNSMLIIHENDLWDNLADHGIEVRERKPRLVNPRYFSREGNGIFKNGIEQTDFAPIDPATLKPRTVSRP